MRLTPSMQQYVSIKKLYQDCILLFQMGDFYETFFDDAKIVSRTLNIVLTSREKDNPIPMAGFPMKALDQYLPKLINAGYKVAIAKQIEDPSNKGLVKRKVVEIVTKATLTTEEQLGKQKSKYIASFYQSKQRPNLLVIATTDILSGSINIYTLNTQPDLIKDFIRSQDIAEGTALVQDSRLLQLLSTEIPIWPSSKKSIKHFKNIITNHFKATNLLSIGLESDLAIIAVGLLLDYINYLKGTIPAQIKAISFNKDKNNMYLDNITIRNLALLPSNTGEPSLLEVIDNTLTPMGYRLLYESLRRPLLNIDEINHRLTATQLLLGSDTLVESIVTELKNIYDIERLTGLVGLKKITPKQVLMLKRSLIAAFNIFQLINEGKNQKILSLLEKKYGQIKKFSRRLSSLIKFIEYYIHEDASNDFSTGPVINAQNFNDIKELRDLTTNAHKIIENLMEDIKKNYNLDKIRLGMNKIYGYYLEIPKSQAKKLPDTFIRKQTLVNTERFITPELKELETKIESAQAKLYELEQKYYNEFIEGLRNNYLTLLNKIYSIIGFIDFTISSALWAKANNATKPTLIPKEKGPITITTESRHPVVEARTEQFIPNSVELDNLNRFIILTGPNMGGKSTYIRQIALIQVLAQIGYFVPAQNAKLSIKDRIFARVGASDNIAEQMSTFMVEMSEISNIIKHATENSLIILDEVGRGTSAWEGISLAYAISEYIINTIKAHTLFATHYFELTELENKYPGVKNFKVDVFEDKDNVIFLHTISPGPAEKSYGIHIAKMVNLPQEILKRAEEILRILNQRNIPSIASQENIKHNVSPIQQPHLITVEPDANIKKIIQKLEEIDPNNITPLQALEFIHNLKSLLSKIKHG